MDILCCGFIVAAGVEPQARVTFDNGATYWWKYYLSTCPDSLNPDQDDDQVNPNQPLEYYMQLCLNTTGCYGFDTGGSLKNGFIF